MANQPNNTAAAASSPRDMAVDENFDQAEALFQSKYDMSAKLGEGTYGTVYKGRNMRTGETIAVKVMKLGSDEEGVPATAIREVALLKELSHRNVVQLLDVFCKPSKLVLVFEYLENDLKKYMKSLGMRLSPSTVKSLAYQLCCGIEFCHSNRVIHRDLKPQNLLIDSSVRMKIADFGLARAFSLPVPVYTHEVVTVWYRPPEILLGSTFYSIPVDIWGIGCVIAEMATGGPLFCGDSEIGTILKIFEKLGTPTEDMWPGLSALPDFKPCFPRWAPKGWSNIRNTQAQVGTDGIDLLERLLCYDPRKRLSARSALVHSYFRDVDQALPGGQK
jgi:serine/threonine protein kinase